MILWNGPVVKETTSAGRIAGDLKKNRWMRGHDQRKCREYVFVCVDLHHRHYRLQGCVVHEYGYWLVERPGFRDEAGISCRLAYESEGSVHHIHLNHSTCIQT